MILNGTAISLDITHVPRHHRNVHNSSHATSNHYHVAVITSDITSPHSHNVRAQQSQTFTTLAYTQDFTSPTRLRQHRNSQRWTSPVHETASLPTLRHHVATCFRPGQTELSHVPVSPNFTFHVKHIFINFSFYRYIPISISSSSTVTQLRNHTCPPHLILEATHPTAGEGTSKHRGRRHTVTGLYSCPQPY